MFSDEHIVTLWYWSLSAESRPFSRRWLAVVDQKLHTRWNTARQGWCWLRHQASLWTQALTSLSSYIGESSNWSVYHHVKLTHGFIIIEIPSCVSGAIIAMIWWNYFDVCVRLHFCEFYCVLLYILYCFFFLLLILSICLSVCLLFMFMGLVASFK